MMRMRGHREVLVATLLAFSGYLAGCSSGSDGGGPTNPPPDLVEPIIEVAGPGTASVGKALDFDAMAVLPAGVSSDSVRWTVSDGQSFTGESISVSFAQPGLYELLVEVLSGATVVAETTAVVSVLDPAQGGHPAFEPIPTVFGDVNQNGAFELNDVLFGAQAAIGLFTPDLEGSQAGDLNLNGLVDAIDAELLAQARVSGQALPTALLDTAAFPAGTVALVSSALNDPDSAVSITVDGFAAPQVFRAILGYATFVVPPELVGTDSLVDVVLSVDGNEAARLPLLLRATPALPANAKADVEQFLAEIESLFAAHETDAAALIQQVGGTSADFEAIVLGASRGAALEFAAAAEGLRELLEADGGEALAQFLQAVFYAQGLSDFRAQMGGSKAFAKNVTPASVCDVLVPAACGLKATASAANLGSKIFAGACSTAALVAVVGGAVIPADGPALEATALAGFVKFCLPLLTPIEIAGIVSDFVKAIEPGFDLSSDKTSLNDDEMAILTAGVSFNGLGVICEGAVGFGSQQLITKKLGERVVGLLMTRSTTHKILGEIFSKVGEDVYAKLLQTIAGIVGSTLDATGVANAYGDVVTKICNVLPSTGTLTADASDFNLMATNNAMLSFNGDGTASLACPAPMGTDPVGTVTVSGSKVLCGSAAKTDSVAVACGSGQVTITMGDNGSLNDDIFEVIIDGLTVLTSSTPVRSTSVTLALPKGEVTVLMRGRAAPDGVGTYFINFTGATVLPGSAATSGTDLTPGVTKTFTIEVL